MKLNLHQQVDLYCNPFELLNVPVYIFMLLLIYDLLVFPLNTSTHSLYASAYSLSTAYSSGTRTFLIDTEYPHVSIIANVIVIVFNSSKNVE